MSLNGANWSRNNESAHCDISQKAVLGRPGGGAWRMPTRAEQEELVNNCSWQWVTSYNNVSVKGYVVTGNGNSIFLPAAGFRYNSNRGYEGAYCGFWSSSLDEGSSDNAQFMDFNITIGSAGRNVVGLRYYGFSVRAVCE